MQLCNASWEKHLECGSAPFNDEMRSILCTVLSLDSVENDLGKFSQNLTGSALKVNSMIKTLLDSACYNK